jgi:hypothetical protein
MKYRAIAVGIENDGHPVQSCGQHLANTQDWARKIAKQFKAEVRIYILEERLLEIVKPETEHLGQLGQPETQGQELLLSLTESEMRCTNTECNHKRAVHGVGTNDTRCTVHTCGCIMFKQNA